jgi:hypothetical protein
MQSNALGFIVIVAFLMLIIIIKDILSSPPCNTHSLRPKKHKSHLNLQFLFTSWPSIQNHQTNLQLSLSIGINILAVYEPLETK